MDLFFVLWVFVIENLNKGNMNMEMFCLLCQLTVYHNC